MREMLEEQDHTGNEAADIFSSRVTRGTSNSVRRQMFSHSDFGTSHIRFQTNTENTRENGAAPLSEGHELVHTVNRNSVPARISRSVDYGTIQREPESDDPAVDQVDGNSSTSLSAEHAAAPNPNPNNLDNSQLQQALQQRQGRQRADQEKLQQIFDQAKTVQKINTASGWMKSAAGALSAAGGICTVSGAGAPIGLGLGVLSAALSAFRFGYEKLRKRSMRHNVAGEEFGINRKKEMDDVKNMVAVYNFKMRLRDMEIREIILKAHGSAETTRTDAFKAITKKRAKYLLDTADPQNHSPFAGVAAAVIEAMGVHKVGNSFANGALDLLAAKLG